MIEVQRTKMLHGKRSGIKRLFWAGAGLLLIMGACLALWTLRFPTYTPLAVAQDVRAASQAGSVEEFLELRYGPLTEPTNRQKAFLDFFNPDHLEGLYRIVSLLDGERKDAVVTAMSAWIADYRRGLTSKERETLRAYINSDAGRATIQKAAAAYLREDVAYRAATAPVVAELMATLVALQER